MAARAEAAKKLGNAAYAKKDYTPASFFTPSIVMQHSSFLIR